MTSSKYSDTPSSPPPPSHSYYHPLPADPRSPPQPQYVIILPRYYDTTSYYCRLWSRRTICFAFLILLFCGAVFFLWPSDPEVSIVRLHLDHFQFRALPVSLDINLDLTVRVRNKDFYSLDYKSLVVSIGYRGKQLGVVNSNHGHVRARASSYVNATLALSGVRVISDVIPLLEDVAKGEIIFDTVSKVDGELGLFFIKLPLQAEVSCEINVDIHNQTIERQNCYPQ